LITFEFIFVVLVFTCGYPVFPATFVEEAAFFPSCVLDFFVEDQLAVAMWVYVWVSYSNTLVFMSVFVQYYVVFIVMAL
jgi:hypothetical protein